MSSILRLLKEASKSRGEGKEKKGPDLSREVARELMDAIKRGDDEGVAASLRTFLAHSTTED
jgi:hypothetical protein